MSVYSSNKAECSNNTKIVANIWINKIAALVRFKNENAQRRQKTNKPINDCDNESLLHVLMFCVKFIGNYSQLYQENQQMFYENCCLSLIRLGFLTPSFKFREELNQYQYNFRQLLNYLFRVGWK